MNRHDVERKNGFGGDEKERAAEDEAAVITMCDPAAAFTSPVLKGMSLDLSLAAEAKCYAAGPVVQEELVNVVFDLADGSQGESQFKLGQTVEVLKSFVESEYGIPMAEQKLFLNGSGQAMLSPLSLLDFAEIKGSTITCTQCTAMTLTMTRRHGRGARASGREVAQELAQVTSSRTRRRRCCRYCGYMMYIQ